MITKLLEQLQKLAELTGNFSDFIIEPSFNAELNSKAKTFLFPAALLATVSWVPFLFIDISLHPDIPLLIPVRLTLSLVGLVILFLFIFRLLIRYSYVMLAIIIAAMALLSGVMVGLVRADPVYMGGYCITLLIIPFIPLRRRESILILLASLVVYFITGMINRIEYSSSNDLYSLANIIIASIMATLAVYFFDRERKTSYGKSYLIQQTNTALETSNLDLIRAKQKIEQTSEKLNQANQNLTREIELKSDLMHVAVHNLKNPLQVILGYVEVLKMDNHEHPKNLAKLQKVEKSVTDMIDIISKLLESERAEKDNIPIRRQNLGLKQLLESVIQNNRVQASMKNQAIQFDSDSEIHFNGDPHLMNQIFENLISNAIKFSRHDSMITIRLSQKPSFIQIVFKDCGPGLSEKDHAGLFKKFKKLSAKPTGNENSSGLGLSIVKRYVELHQGKIYAINNSEGGASFIVEF